jgi:hypothetical protein
MINSSAKEDVIKYSKELEIKLINLENLDKKSHKKDKLFCKNCLLIQEWRREVQKIENSYIFNTYHCDIPNFINFYEIEDYKSRIKKSRLLSIENSIENMIKKFEYENIIFELNSIHEDVLSGKIRDGKILDEVLKDFSFKLSNVLINEINRENRRREVEKNEKITKIEKITFFIQESQNGRTSPKLIKVQVNNLSEHKTDKKSNFIFLYNLYVNGQQKIDKQKWKNKLKSFKNDNSYFIKQSFTKEDINLLFEVQNNGISQIIKLKNRNIFNTKNI